MTDVVGTANWSAGGALRLAVHVPFIRKPWGRRRAWTFGVDVTPAYAFSLEPGLANGFQLGVMANTGIEFYEAARGASATSTGSRRSTCREHRAREERVR